VIRTNSLKNLSHRWSYLALSLAFISCSGSVCQAQTQATGQKTNPVQTNKSLVSSQTANPVQSANALKPTTGTQSKTTTTDAKTAPVAAKPVASAVTELVALQGPQQIVHMGNAWKENPCYISVKQGQEILPLTLTFNNGVNGAAPIKFVRVSLNGRRLFTDVDFKGKNTLSLKMDGFLTAGDTQMVVQTFGSQGSSLNWVLTTPKIKVSDIKPDTAAPGDKVTISGKNLPKRTDAYKVFVGEKAATIKAVTEKQIDFIVPDGVAGGKQNVTLYIAGVKCDPLVIKIKATAELSGTNVVDAPPGTILFIYGKGFSTTASDNQIFFNGVPAPVSKATATQLDVTVPSIEFPQYNVQITGKLNGQNMKGNASFNCTIRTIYKDEAIGPGNWN
jgi:hypothetical protein